MHGLLLLLREVISLDKLLLLQLECCLGCQDLLILHLGLVEGVELGLRLGGSSDDLLDLVLLKGSVLQEAAVVPLVLFLSDE